MTENYIPSQLAKQHLADTEVRPLNKKGRYTQEELQTAYEFEQNIKEIPVAPKEPDLPDFDGDMKKILAQYRKTGRLPKEYSLLDFVSISKEGYYTDILTGEFMKMSSFTKAQK